MTTVQNGAGLPVPLSRDYKINITATVAPKFLHLVDHSVVQSLNSNCDGPEKNRNQESLSRIRHSMERKAKDTVRRLLKDVLMLGVLPFVAYLAAQWLYGSALLVGPYLLASPLIAVTIFVRTLRLHKILGAKKTSYEADPAFSERASRFSVKLGLSQVTVFIESEDGFGIHPAIRMHEDGLHVRLDQWSQMSEPEREFGMVQSMAFKANARKPEKVTSWLTDIALFAGYVIATQNLWLILVMHAGGLAGFYHVQQRLDGKATLAGDRGALALTGDIDAAESYIRTYAGKIGWLSNELEPRIAALRKSWAEMQST